MTWLFALLFAVLACAPEALRMDASWDAGAVEVRTTAPVRRVEVFRPDGTPVATRRLPAPSTQARMELPGARPGELVVRVHGGSDVAETLVEVPGAEALSIEVEAPLGQGRRPVRDGEVLSVIQVGGQQTPIGLVVSAQEPREVHVGFAGGVERVVLRTPGERITLRRALPPDERVAVAVVSGAHEVRFELAPEALSLEAARAQLAVADVTLPVDATGAVDHSRPLDRITLPARWWTEVLRRIGLGYRPRDDQAPWCWQVVTLRNDADAPVNLVVSSRVLDRSGRVDPAFRPRLREVEHLEAVRVLVRIPASSTGRAVLPVYVDSRSLPAEGGVWTREIAVTTVGAAEPLHVVSRPLFVTRGNRLASLGFAGAILASLAGWVVLWRQGRGWVVGRQTSELMTIALVGSLTFVVGAASQLVGMGVASVLGPFAPLVMGVFDDAFRACLLGTLVVLVPRPGVVSLATLVGYLMRGLALGSMHPVDALYLGAAVFFLEGMLWGAGLTRGGAWREEARWRRWVRLSVGFGGANLLATATSLLVSIVVYRLYYAGWYVGLILLFPGFLYVCAGCWVAVDFSASLRRVES